MLSIWFFLVLVYSYGSLGVPLVPKNHDALVELFRFTSMFHWNHYIALPNFSDVWHSLGLTKKKGEHVENIKFSWDTQLNFMFSTCSTVFCCLSSRGPDVSQASLRFLYIFGDPGLLCVTPMIMPRPCPSTSRLQRTIFLISQFFGNGKVTSFRGILGQSWKS